jgi:hypothetical protein
MKVFQFSAHNAWDCDCWDEREFLNTILSLSKWSPEPIGLADRPRADTEWVLADFAPCFASLPRFSIVYVVYTLNFRRFPAGFVGFAMNVRPRLSHWCQLLTPPDLTRLFLSHSSSPREFDPTFDECLWRIGEKNGEGNAADGLSVSVPVVSSRSLVNSCGSGRAEVDFGRFKSRAICEGDGDMFSIFVDQNLGGLWGR